MIKQQLKRIFAATLILTPFFMGDGNEVAAQDVSDLANSNPLIMTGAIASQNTYYHSSVGEGYASPMSNTLTAKMKMQLRGLTMPFTLYYANRDNNFSHPHFMFSLNPKYKNWTGYIGQSSLSFNPYTFDMSFQGIGVEYQQERGFRFGAFYGILNRAINDNPTDPEARSPQYKRLGWGLKAGYGSEKNYVEVYLFRAFDRPGSLHEEWREQVQAQENLVAGIRGCVTVTPWLSFTANAATSAFSTDLDASKIDVESVAKYDDIFDAKYSSLMRFAGDLNANFSFNNFNAVLSYRMVQPDYTSLGVLNLSNNYQSLGLSVATTIKNKVALSGSFSAQEDNLTNDQLYTTRAFVYSTEATANILENLSMTLSYNGYRQVQGAGTMPVNDTTRVNRVMHSLTVKPQYEIDAETLNHTFAFAGSYTQNKDLNQFATGESDVTTWSAGLTYDMLVKSIETTFSTTFSHQTSKGYDSRYTTDLLSIGASRSFLKNDNLTAGANINLCNNNITGQRHNSSIGADMTLGYVIDEVHNFTLTAGLNKYYDVNITEEGEYFNASDVNISLNYTYTFSLADLQNKLSRKNKNM